MAYSKSSARDICPGGSCRDGINVAELSTMKNTQSTRISALCLLPVFLAASGCKLEETLGEGFEPKDPPKEDPPAAKVRSPIQPGTQLSYIIQHSFWPDTFAETQVFNDNEKEIVGQLCLRVDEVRDTIDEDYAGAAETLVLATTHLSGLSENGMAFEDYIFSDNSDVNASVETLDAYFAPMLLELATPATRGHGLLEPISVEYNTRGVALPPNADINHLFFFETRPVEGSWGGWESSAESQNFVTGITADYMLNSAGLSFTSNTTFFRSTVPVTDCGALADAGACGLESQSCTFRDGICRGKHVVTVAWRENISTGPAALVGDVVHQLNYVYTDDGILREVAEYIVEDTAPELSMSNFMSSKVSGNYGCLAADQETDVPCLFMLMLENVDSSYAGQSCAIP